MAANSDQVKTPIIPDFRRNITRGDLALLSEAVFKNSNELKNIIDELTVINNTLEVRILAAETRIAALEGN